MPPSPVRARLLRSALGMQRCLLLLLLVTAGAPARALESHALRILSPTVLELWTVTTKEPEPARVPIWDFVDETGTRGHEPPPSAFTVKCGGRTLPVEAVHFRRRPIFAPLDRRDLRLGQSLYLVLARPVPAGESVTVTSAVLPKGLPFTARAERLRPSPAIHVNQVGYLPDGPKRAHVGLYLGDGGELPLAALGSFEVVDGKGGAVFRGPLRPRPDRGFKGTPPPYQQVLEADFDALRTPGEYRVVIEGLGASLPFRVHEGVAGAFARTYALGLFHQRCGWDQKLPFTRFADGLDHVAPAEVPTAEPAFARAWALIAESSGAGRGAQESTAPQLRSIDTQRYPIVRRAPIDVSGGHHDAGDYSKYALDSAALVHALTFAADALPGVGALDNLGLPESGDGVGDVLQEARWEAEFLANLQDDDGGFFFLVYPKTRRYEHGVLPQAGDAQIVWPKNTAATAAAVAALAELGSSPRFRRAFPAEAARYLQKARAGWDFLERALARDGRAGAYQRLTHYGDQFGHDDELAWAAAALFAATGEVRFFEQLKQWMPDPNAPALRLWTWVRAFEGWGAAMRTYAFAARSGRRQPQELDADYLSRAEAELIAAGDEVIARAGQSAYGVSFPLQSKSYGLGGYFFPLSAAFDAVVAGLLSDPQRAVEAVVGNLDYEAGANPLNVSFVPGLGLQRPHEQVSQFALADRRVLPPTGIPWGSISAGMPSLPLYRTPAGVNELTRLVYPSDAPGPLRYPLYDRWADTFQVRDEITVVAQGRALASALFLFARTRPAATPWAPRTAKITGVKDGAPVGTRMTVSLSAPGLDLSDAQIVWEASGLDPVFGPTCTFASKNEGAQWIEAEAMLPDGRRLFAAIDFAASSASGAMRPARR